jgi:P-type Cu2+ transporter
VTVLLANAYTTSQAEWSNDQIASARHMSPWTVLDTPEQWLQFSQTVSNATTRPANEHTGTASLVESQLLLNGLYCAACSGIIERGLLALPGVIIARVSIAKNRAVVTWSPSLTKPSLMIEAITALGYGAVPASHPRDQAAALAKQRTAFWRWMVAGFCMMQVMMYAGPSYFTQTTDMTTDMRQLLNWASWLLSLPVMLFSSKGFFSQALNDLKTGKISMDLPVALGILITFIVSSAATFEPNSWWGNTVYFDSLTMFVFFILSARLIEAKLNSKTMGALETLISRMPESISRQNKDGSFSRVLNHELKIGDIVQVSLGEAFPGDGKLVGERSDINTVITSVDESLLTGEAKPIAKTLDDKVIAGSFNLGRVVLLCIEKLGNNTQFGQIVQLIQQAGMEKPRLAKIADAIAKPFLILVLTSATLAAALLWQVDRGQALMTAAAVLIVTCPCALSLATPAAMLASASAFVKRGILIRNLQAIESIAEIDTIIFDKTGTLTEADMQVTALSHAPRIEKSQAIVIASQLATRSLHPVAKAVLQYGMASNQTAKTINMHNVKEIVGGGLRGIVTENLTTFDRYMTPIHGEIKLGSAVFCELDIGQLMSENKDSQSYDNNQYVYLADNQGWLATFTLQEHLKPGVASMVGALKKARINVQIVSGDQAQSVAKVAQNIGVNDYLSAQNPQQKLAHLQALKMAGHKVLMVGDGLNDGPTVASAHASIAMGKGVPLTLAQADYILLHGDVAQIPALIAHAKKAMRIIKQNLFWALVYNAVCIPLAFFGVLSAWLAGLGMAVSSLVVILNALRQTHYTPALRKDLKGIKA